MTSQQGLFRPALYDRSRIENPERTLGLAVLHQAFWDAKKGQSQALGWVRGNSPQLTFWCHVADVQPGAVRKAARGWFPSKAKQQATPKNERCFVKTPNGYAPS